MSKLEELLRRNGITEADLKPSDPVGDALCELAEMVAEQEEAILELAELVGGRDDG